MRLPAIACDCLRLRGTACDCLWLHATACDCLGSCGAGQNLLTKTLKSWSLMGPRTGVQNRDPITDDKFSSAVHVAKVRAIGSCCTCVEFLSEQLESQSISRCLQDSAKIGMAMSTFGAVDCLQTNAKLLRQRSNRRTLGARNWYRSRCPKLCPWHYQHYLALKYRKIGQHTTSSCYRKTAYEVF